MFNKERLKQYLDEKELNQEQIAELFECSQQYVSFLLSGTKQPSIALLARICKVTGLSADELLIVEK